MRPTRHRTGTGLTPPSPTSWPTPNTPGTWSTAGAARPDGRGSTRRLVPPEQWIWSEQPTHPAIITRDMFSAAQGIAAEHRSAGAPPHAPPRRRPRRTYALRGRVRHRSCQRRMCGTTRTFPRYWAEGPDYSNTYYKCTHDTDNPKHAAAHPGPPPHRHRPRRHPHQPDPRLLRHPRIRPRPRRPPRAADPRQRRPGRRSPRPRPRPAGQRTRPHRPRAAIPDHPDRHPRPRPREHRRPGHAPALLRRFTGLQAEREATQTQLEALDSATTPGNDTALLDLIPCLPTPSPCTPSASRPRCIRPSTSRPSTKTT